MAVDQMYPSLSEGPRREITPRPPLNTFFAIADRLGVEIPVIAVAATESWWRNSGTRRRRRFVNSDLRQGLPSRDDAVDASAPQYRGRDGEMGSLCPRIRLATGYSELVDPVVQRERLEPRPVRRPPVTTNVALDEGLLAAMECAMPPTTGTGVGRPAADGTRGLSIRGWFCSRLFDATAAEYAC